jgi:two-component system, sporulation sensor kinase B
LNHFIEQLFLHLFMMLLIPLVHSFLKRDERSSKLEHLFLGTIIFSLFLTMICPVTLSYELSFDFKFVPIFIAFYYINRRIGISLVVLMLLFKWFTHDPMFYFLILNYTILSIGLILSHRMYQKGSVHQKIVIAFVFYLIISSTNFIWMYQIQQTSDWIYLITFTLSSFFILSTVIYLIEMNHFHYSMRLKLQTADKLNAISQLAASVAHEIRNPMTTIKGFMQILKDENNLTDSQKMYVSLSLEELNRTQHIIDDFLSLARPNKQENETILVSKTLYDVIEFLRPYSMIGGVNYHLNIKEDLQVIGDTNEFKQLMINLIKNAIEAMPEGGMLQISAHTSREETIIEIKDEGIGISNEQLSQLGQPYYSTKSKGTGLGLLISFDIVKRMGGKVNIESKINVGTTFTLSFPNVKE